VLPPLFDGANHDSATDLMPAVAVSDRGADGGLDAGDTVDGAAAVVGAAVVDVDDVDVDVDDVGAAVVEVGPVVEAGPVVDVGAVVVVEDGGSLGTVDSSRTDSAKAVVVKPLRTIKP
jgi:hypothetical protein